MLSFRLLVSEIKLTRPRLIIRPRNDTPEATLSESVAFQFLAKGLLAILAAGAVLMALVSVGAGPFDSGASTTAAWWAAGFFVAAVFLGLLEILSRQGSDEGW
jgi:hypothetical protein